MNITMAQALAAAQDRGLARIDAQMLLLHALGRSPYDRAWLIAHDMDALPAEAASSFEQLGARRQQGEPVAYSSGARPSMAWTWPSMRVCSIHAPLPKHWSIGRWSWLRRWPRRVSPIWARAAARWRWH